VSTLRIAGIGDSHLSEKNRLDDNVAVHQAFVDQARDAKVGLILHGGDFFDSRSTPTERNALASFLQAAAAVAPVVGVKGNHDVDDDLAVFSQLRARENISIFERPEVLVTRGVAIVCLPWFTKAGVVAAMAADAPIADSTEATISAARRLLAALRMQAERAITRGDVPIFVGHVMVAGSETSTGQVLIGSTVELAPSEILEVGGAYSHLSHIHKAQSWYDGRVSYCGSPQRHTFGENEPKGWNLVTIDTERWREPGGVTVEFRELPARRIVLLEEDWAASGPPEFSMELTLAARVEAGDLVRLRYRIKPEDLHLIDEARIATILRSEGAHSVQLEAVLVHQDRVRCAEIVTALDTFEKCKAYWSAKDIDVTEAQRIRVRAKLEEIERRERAEVAA